jgi:hypothetical protein
MAEEMGRSREAVAGLIKRGIRQLRVELGALPPPEAKHASASELPMENGDGG